MKPRGLIATLTDEEKERVLLLRSQGCSLRDIAMHVGRAYSTVAIFISGKDYRKPKEEVYFNVDVYASEHLI
jgi:IS30 family transposase